MTVFKSTCQLIPVLTVRFCLPGGEAVTEDSLREDHETDPEEDRHGNQRRPGRRVNSRRPVCRQGGCGGPTAAQDAEKTGREEVVGGRG